MKNKFNLKSFVLGLVVATVLVSSLGNAGFAKSARENIKVLYNNIKIVVDNKPVKFGKDSSGKQIEPFIYNGTTYLPIRAVGEALGKEVDWDGANQTVYVGKRDKKALMMADKLEPHNASSSYIYRSSESEKLNIAGKDYATGYKLRWSSAKLNFNLDSQYSELEFDLGPAGDYGDYDRNLLIYLDGELKHNYVVNGNDGITRVTIPVRGVNQLRIETSDRSSPNIGIGDPIIK